MATATAERLGGQTMIIFVRDPEVDAFLPVPGFRQTLPDGRAWRAFIEACARDGRCSSTVRLIASEPERPALGIARGGAVAVLIGAAEPPAGFGDLEVALPYLAATFRAELRLAATMAQVKMARAVTEQGTALSRSRDAMRSALQDAHSRLRRQAADLERANEQLQEQTVELEMQTEELLAEVEAHRAAAAGMAEREARYRALVDATTDLILVSDADGRMTAEQPSWTACTGQLFQQYLGFGWLDAIHPDDRTLVEMAWPRAIADKVFPGAQARVRGPDGAYRLFHFRSVAITSIPDGSLREWVTACTDVTDHVRTEGQLRQAQTLHAVGTLAGGMAHEVNNQMTAVLGFGQFVLSALGPAHPAFTDVQHMVRAGERTAKVTQQVLAFSRRHIIFPCVVELAGLLSELAPVLTRLLGSDKSLLITPSPSQARVSADPTQLEQVIINLTTNARDAMGTGGRLTISLDEVQLSDAYAREHAGVHIAPGPYVLLAVSDTGAGMDRETVARIFDPFFTTKAVDKGTGLGLSMVYGIIKQHRGFVWAYSEVGLGTTIKVYLPAITDPAGPAIVDAVTAAGSESNKLSGTVLVVEDHAVLRQLARRTLEAAGYTVLEAADGREALAIVNASEVRPSVVITDVIMPGLNGRELSDELSLIDPDLPILFTSGYTGDDVVVRRLVPEGAPFLQKPFTPDALVWEVRRLARRDGGRGDAGPG